MNKKSEEKSGVTPFLQMRGISKSYSGVQVLHNVNLSVNTSEVLALVGENGAGKSTLIKTLAGAIRSDKGEILIQGKKVEFQTPLEAENNGIATVYQELNLFPYLTVTENLFFSSFHGRKDPFRGRSYIRRRRNFSSRSACICERRGWSPLSASRKSRCWRLPRRFMCRLAS
jgi:ABC-type sugar transport system ATPase subunit